MGILFIPMFIVGIIMMVKNPMLLKSRLDAKEKQKEQGIVIKLSGLMFVVGFILAGLDFRYKWISIPSFIPYVDECNCEKDEFYYRPCYRIDKDDFYIVSILASCDFPATEGYPFDTNLLVTYDRSGNVIDYKTVAIGSDVEQYKIESGEKENELTITQQSFTEIISVSGIYTGKCNVSIYKIRINDDGTIRKETICEYEDNLPIEL